MAHVLSFCDSTRCSMSDFFRSKILADVCLPPRSCKSTTWWGNSTHCYQAHIYPWSGKTVENMQATDARASKKKSSKFVSRCQNSELCRCAQRELVTIMTMSQLWTCHDSLPHWWRKINCWQSNGRPWWFSLYCVYFSKVRQPCIVHVWLHNGSAGDTEITLSPNAVLDALLGCFHLKLLHKLTLNARKLSHTYSYPRCVPETKCIRCCK